MELPLAQVETEPGGNRVMGAGGRKLRWQAMRALAGLILSASLAVAQELPAPNALPQPPAGQPSLGAPEPLGAPAAAAPGPDAAAPIFNPNPIELPRDPGQNGWAEAINPYVVPAAAPTSDFWYVILEAQVVRPFVKNALSATLTFPDGSTNTISPPSASLQWTGSPYLEVGYRLADSLGQFSLSYRFLYSDGTENVTDINGVPYQLRSEVVLNYGDFDYGTVPYMIYPHWFLQARLGVRLADLYFNTRAVSATDNQFDSNNFFGGGPHARLDLWRNFGVIPGLALFGRLDGAVVVGQIRQNYTEDITTPGGPLSGSFVIRRTQSVLVFLVQAGLMYTPPRAPNTHYSIGYQYEEWRDVGEIDNYPAVGNYLSNGAFFRAVIDF
jgi:hypothetical protein